MQACQRALAWLQSLALTTQFRAKVELPEGDFCVPRGPVASLLENKSADEQSLRNAASHVAAMAAAAAAALALGLLSFRIVAASHQFDGRAGPWRTLAGDGS